VIIPRKRMWYAILEDYVAKKVDEFLQDEIIPDIALEVINENAVKRNYDLYSAKFRGEIKYVEQLCDKVVKRLAHEAVQEDDIWYCWRLLAKERGEEDRYL
jgi:hypothetical protein